MGALAIWAAGKWAVAKVNPYFWIGLAVAAVVAIAALGIVSLKWRETAAVNSAVTSAISSDRANTTFQALSVGASASAAATNVVAPEIAVDTAQRAATQTAVSSILAKQGSQPVDAARQAYINSRRKKGAMK